MFSMILSLREPASLCGQFGGKFRPYGWTVYGQIVITNVTVSLRKMALETVKLEHPYAVGRKQGGSFWCGDKRMTGLDG
jgi:hypothetical protein